MNASKDICFAYWVVFVNTYSMNIIYIMAINKQTVCFGNETF